MPQSHAPRSHRTVLRLRAQAGATAAVLGTTLAAAAPLAAQTSITAPVRFETFAARNESTSAAVFGGFSLGAHSGLLGLRVSGAAAGLDMNGSGRIQETPVRVCSRNGCRTVMQRRYGSGSLWDTDAWTVDADVTAEPFRTAPVMRQLLLGFSPYAFAGVGRINAGNSGTLLADTATSVWSYGAGVHHDLVGRVGLTAEGRVRRRLTDNAFINGTMRNSVQYRVGLNIGLGGRPKRTTRRTGNGVTIVSRRPLSPLTPSAKPAPVQEPVFAGDEREVSAAIPMVLDAAEAQLNTRWLEGGTSPSQGFDAGGFVQYVFAQERIELPRLVRDLAVTGTSVSIRIGALRSGDLLFFSNDGITPNHVGIYVGRDRFVHASASGGGVVYDVLGEGPRGTWFADHLLTARRVTGGRTPASRSSSPVLTPSGRPDRAPRPGEAR